LLGLGGAEAADWIEIRGAGPSGASRRFENIRGGRYYVLSEGKLQ
jgi:hypothetical protein